jgi:hypothetical protein
MARCLINILDRNLYIPKEGDLYRPLPSPEALKGMVLLKGKRESGIREEDDEDSDGDTDSDISAEHTVAHAGEVSVTCSYHNLCLKCIGTSELNSLLRTIASNTNNPNNC